MAKKNKFICKRCGKEYYSYKEKSDYCSKECKDKDNEFYLDCEFCGKRTKTYRYIYEKYIKGEKDHFYCSKECSNKAHTKKVKKVCENCGKEFYISNVFSDVQKYCSNECYVESKSKNSKILIRICPICGKEFKTYHKEQVYCSRECAGKKRQKRVSCICEHCGKSFERIESEFNKNEHHFCSKECKINFFGWKEIDMNILKELYGKVKNSIIQKELSEYHSLREISRKARDLNLDIRKYWSDEEIKILIDNYETMPMNELMDMLPGRTAISIIGKSRTYNLISYFTRNYIYTEAELNFLRDNYLIMSNENLAREINRSEKAIGLKLWQLQLLRPNNPISDKYKDLSDFVRNRLDSWKKSVREDFNYTCCLTGERSNLIIHHCLSFNLLIEETIYALDFDERDDFSEYTEEDLNEFLDVFLYLQESHHEYVCITEWVHKLFHSKYGYGYNTPEQWREFVGRFKNNEFNKVA